MAKKPLLDATSKPPSPYSEFTKNYRLSADVEDRRGKDRAMLDSGTPSRYKGGDLEAMKPDNKGSTGRTGRKGRGYETVTPDDYQTGDIGGKADKTTPGSGFPSVTSDQQSRLNYAPIMEDYIKKSKE